MAATFQLGSWHYRDGWRWQQDRDEPRVITLRRIDPQPTKPKPPLKAA